MRLRCFLLMLCSLIPPVIALAEEPDLNQVIFVPRSLLEDIGQALGAAEVDAARPLVQIALEMIEYFEHWMPSAYNDPAGYCSIGYGHLVAQKECEAIELGNYSVPLSQLAGATLLASDTASARLAIQNIVSVDLSEEQFGALTSFVFNVGKGNFARSTMLRLLNLGNYELAANEFPRWVRSKGQLMNGLVSRRACEATLFRGQLTVDSNGRFDRSLCETLGGAPTVGPLIDIETGE